MKNNPVPSQGLVNYLKLWVLDGEKFLKGHLGRLACLGLFLGLVGCGDSASDSVEGESNAAGVRMPSASAGEATAGMVMRPSDVGGASSAGSPMSAGSTSMGGRPIPVETGGIEDVSGGMVIPMTGGVVAGQPVEAGTAIPGGQSNAAGQATIGGGLTGGEPDGGAGQMMDGGAVAGGQPWDGGLPMTVESGGAMAIEGCDQPAYDLNRGSRPDGSFKIRGIVARDNFDGTCKVRGTRGADALVEFTAPSGREWVFTTLGTEFATILYAFRDCSEPGEQLTCVRDLNFDAFLPHSEMRLFMAGGERVFLAVDRYQGFSDGEFLLTARPFVAPNPPELASASAVYTQGNESLGFRLTGTDLDQDIATVGYTYWQNGVQLSQRPRFARLGSIQYGDDGAFSAIASTRFIADDRERNFDEIKVQIIDVRNQKSVVLSAPVMMSEVGGDGDLCDGQLFGCGPDLLCGEGRCQSDAELRRCPDDWPVARLRQDQLGRSVFMGTADGPHRVTGSCGVDGATMQVLEYVPIRDGRYFIGVDAIDENGELAPADVDPILLARRHCTPWVADEITELACVDRAANEPIDLSDYVAGRLSPIAALDLNADEPVYLYVSGRQDWAGGYRLRVIPDNAPRLTQVRGVVDREQSYVSIRVEGLDIDPIAARMFLETADGQAIPSIDADDGSWNESFSALSTTPEGRFVGYIHLPMGDEVRLFAVGRIRLQVIDKRGNESAVTDAQVGAPTERIANQPCDIHGRVDMCIEPDSFCVSAFSDCPEPCGYVDPIISPARCRLRVEPPVIEGEVTYFERDPLSGIPSMISQIRVADIDGIQGFRLAFTIADQQEQTFIDGVFSEVTPLGGDGNAFDVRIERAFPELRDVRTMRIELIIINAVGLESAPRDIQRRAPNVLGVDQECGRPDVVCDIGLSCVTIGENATCLDIPLTCPAEWNAVPLLESLPGNLLWTHEGELSGQSPSVAAQCALETFAQPHVFSHMNGGVLSCSVSSDEFEPVLWVRWACGLNDSTYELACKRLPPAQELEPQPTLEFYAPAGRQLQYFVGSTDGRLGRYTLTCTGNQGPQ